MTETRRGFLKAVGGTAALAWVGCSGSGPSHEERAAVEGGTPVCSDPFAGGVLVGTASFIGESSPRMETKLGTGLAGRLFTDLAKLDHDAMTIDTERFFIRSFAPDRLDTDRPWLIRVRGHVAQEADLALASFESRIQPMGSYLMECSGNGRGEHFGLMSACNWSGIPLADVLGQTAPTRRATRLVVEGFDDHTYPSTRSTIGASWIFTPEQLSRAFLATQMNGEPLTRDHGFPVRLFVPGWYGAVAIKWVEELRWVDDDVQATSQMTEFASRTHQHGVPELARDYLPAEIVASATPVRIEQWSLAGRTVHRIVGVLWGGKQPNQRFEIQIGDDRPWEPVDVCPAQVTNDSWTLWTHAWRPAHAGPYPIRLRVTDPGVRSIRLDYGHYSRTALLQAV